MAQMGLLKALTHWRWQSGLIQLLTWTMPIHSNGCVQHGDWYLLLDGNLWSMCTVINGPRIGKGGEVPRSTRCGGLLEPTKAWLISAHLGHQPLVKHHRIRSVVILSFCIHICNTIPSNCAFFLGEQGCLWFMWINAQINSHVGHNSQ